MKDMLRQKSKRSGMGLVEAMLATTVLLFVSYATLNVLSSGYSSSEYLSKKVTLADELDERVEEYILTGTFDTTSSGSFSFSEADITNEGNNGQGNGNSTTYGNPSGGTTGGATNVAYNLFKFTATDSVTSVSISHKAFKKSSYA